ncbi:hypothetical protein SAY87_028310 [Trapa incisa]|uniref:Uncharacterized protein n=1 Tax=Trapa incisa TaxID=236973 RepID=A0AAN7KUG6_9MYRT|nr:hypothetical protein SAY87_028310 [Trapa incisa]
MDFHEMQRKKLQSLCKKHGIPANLKNVEMADRLSLIYKEIEEKKGGGQSSVSDSVEIDLEIDSKDLHQRVKKVRFSPDNETFIFSSSDTESTVVKKRPERRKYGKNPNNSNLGTENSKGLDGFVNNVRAHLAITRKTRAGRVSETIDHCGKPTASSEPISCSDHIMGQRGSRREVVTKEKQGDCTRNATARSTRQSKPAVAHILGGYTGRVTESMTQPLEEASKTNDSSEAVGVQVENETRNILQLGEPPRRLARKTRSSMALYKGPETIVTSDAVRDRKSTSGSIYNREKLADVLTVEKLNGGADKKNTRKRSTHEAREEGTAECAVSISSTSNELIPRRSRREGAPSQLLSNVEISDDKIVYSQKLQKPIEKETICDNQNEPSGRANLRRSKRNYQKNFALTSEQTMMIASNKKQRGSRMISAGEVDVRESETGMSIMETTNLNLNSYVSEKGLSQEIPDCFQERGNHIKSRASEVDSSVYPEACNGEDEHVVLESDKSSVIKHGRSISSSIEENKEDKLFLDISEDNLNEVDSLCKSTSANVNAIFSDEHGSTMTKPGEGSSGPFNLECNSGAEPSIEEQEAYGEFVEVDSHLAKSSNDPKQIQKSGRYVELSDNQESNTISEEIFEESEDRDHDETGTDDAGDGSSEVKDAPLATVDAADRGVNEGDQNAETVVELVYSAEENMYPKSGSSVVLNEPLKEIDSLEVASCECESAIDLQEVTDRTQEKLSLKEIGAGTETSCLDLDSQNSNEDERDAFQSSKPPVTEQMDSEKILSEANEREEMLQDITEDRSNEKYGFHEDKLVEHGSEVNGIVSHQSATPTGRSGSLASIKESGQNCSLELDLKNQIMEFMDNKRPEINFGDMINESDERDHKDGMEGKIVQEEFPTVEGELAELLARGGAHANDEIVGTGVHEASEIYEETPLKVIETLVVECSMNEGITMTMWTSNDRTATEKISGDIIPMQHECAVIKDEILASKTEDGMICQVQNAEEIVEEIRQMEDILDFIKELSDSIENSSKEVCQMSEEPISISRTELELQIEDTEAIILIPHDDRVDEGRNFSFGLSSKISNSSQSEDGKILHVQNEEEIVEEVKQMEDNHNFSKELSDSIESSPKEVWKMGGEPISISRTKSKLQIKDKHDDRVDEGQNSSFGLSKLFKDEILLSKTKDGKIFHIENEEEIVEETNEMEDHPNFTQELYDSAENSPKELWRGSGEPVCISQTEMELQIEDREPVILIPQDNRVGQGDKSTFGLASKFCQDVDSFIHDKEVDKYKSQNKEEMLIDEDRIGRGLNFKVESYSVIKACLHEESLSALQNSGNEMPSCKDDVSLNEDAHEDKEDEVDGEPSLDYHKGDNADGQVAWSGDKKREDLANVDIDSSIFPSDLLSILCSSDHQGRIYSGCLNFKGLHNTEPVDEDPPGQNILARSSVIDNVVLENLNTKTSMVELNSDKDIRSSKVSPKVGVIMEEQTAQSPEMDHGIDLEDSTGKMSLGCCSDENIVTPPRPNSSCIEIVNTGENCGTVDVAEVFADVPLNSMGSDYPANKENASAIHNSPTYKMLIIDPNTKLNTEKTEEILGTEKATTVIEEEEMLRTQMAMTIIEEEKTEEMFGIQMAMTDFEEEKTEEMLGTQMTMTAIKEEEMQCTQMAMTIIEEEKREVMLGTQMAMIIIEEVKTEEMLGTQEPMTVIEQEKTEETLGIQKTMNIIEGAYKTEEMVDTLMAMTVIEEGKRKEMLDAQMLATVIEQEKTEENLGTQMAVTIIEGAYKIVEMLDTQMGMTVIEEEKRREMLGTQMATTVVEEEKTEETLGTQMAMTVIEEEEMLGTQMAMTVIEEEEMLGTQMSLTVIEEGAHLTNSLPTFGQVAGKQFMVDKEDTRDQIRDYETSSKGSCVDDQVSLTQKDSSSGPGPVRTGDETNHWIFAFIADSSLDREREMIVSPISQVGTCTDCGNGCKESDLQVLTSQEESPVHEGKINVDEAKYREVERQREVIKINESAPCQNSYKMDMKTPRKLPTVFDTMKENIFRSTKKEEVHGSTTGKTLTKGRKALEVLQRNQIPYNME